MSVFPVKCVLVGSKPGGGPGIRKEAAVGPKASTAVPNGGPGIPKEAAVGPKASTAVPKLACNEAVVVVVGASAK